MQRWSDGSDGRDEMVLDCDVNWKIAKCRMESSLNN